MRPVPAVVRRLSACAAALLTAFGAAGPALAEPVVALLGGNQLFTFDSATPGTASAPVAITGLVDTLVGIDLRPSTGVLYGVGSNSSLYTINTTTGAATFIGALSVGLSGNAYGIDFNPVPDLVGNASLRIVSQTGQNLRVNVNPGSIGQVAVDTPLNGGTTGLVGAAYTNNDRDPSTATALYGIIGNSLFQQTVPNAGTTVLVGGLGVSTDVAFTGFDVSASGDSFASLTTPGGLTSSFYRINLATGAATLIGSFGAIGRVTDITALAIAPVVGAIPEPETYALMLAGLAGIGWIARRRRPSNA